MDNSFLLCQWCKISVGFLSCCTCHKQFNLVLYNGLALNCPLCIDFKLDTYYQSDQDGQLHQQCDGNTKKRMYHHCQWCNGYFCPCVEQKSKKQIILNPCPSNSKEQC